MDPVTLFHWATRSAAAVERIESVFLYLADAPDGCNRQQDSRPSIEEMSVCHLVLAS